MAARMFVYAPHRQMLPLISSRMSSAVRELMSGNICRCGAYTNILAAIQRAMRVSEVGLKP